MSKRGVNQPPQNRNLRQGTLDERVATVTRQSIDHTVREITRRAAERFMQHAA